MHLVLCSSSDTSAIWACNGLAALGVTPLHLVTSEMLALSTGWTHRLGSEGIATRFTLPDGTRIDGGCIRGILNRLLAPPEALVAQSVPEDRDYTQQELTALYLSWLSAIPAPVLNRPTPQGLSGRSRHGSEWAMAAHAAGFSVPVYRQEAGDDPCKGYASLAPAGAPVTHVVVLDGETFGPAFGPELPQAAQERCHRLSEICQTQLLGMDLFASPSDPWTFAGATPLPDLQAGGTALLRRMARVFQNWSPS